MKTKHKKKYGAPMHAMSNQNRPMNELLQDRGLGRIHNQKFDPAVVAHFQDGMEGQIMDAPDTDNDND